MNLSAIILERALKQLQLPSGSIDQFRIASALSDVDGRGFPKELFQLSAPVIVRGLLNFAVLQMNRDWVYPFWVHRQLDPKCSSYIPRAQNPLLINVTQRNWTLLGSPHGFHEAIIDRRGLLTPLPREWSVDTWIVTEKEIFFPSLVQSVLQSFDTVSPRVETAIPCGDITVTTSHFAEPTSDQMDVLFTQVRAINNSPTTQSVLVCVAIRPFNPEGVSPIHSIEFRSPKIAFVNKAVGVVFAENPDWVGCNAFDDGDAAAALRSMRFALLDEPQRKQSRCKRGLAHAIALYRLSLEPHQEQSIHYSVALEEENKLKQRPVKQTWRVSYEKRLETHRSRWEKELENGGTFLFANKQLQEVFDAGRLTLLMLQDKDFVSPGAYLYHHFWYRDAAVMLRALDVLGFHKRVRQVIGKFPARLTGDGFFCGPDGEWDSNGAVLWTVLQHWLLTRSDFWLKGWLPLVDRGAQWITRMRARTPNKLMPQSLSAEHLGTVDQYFWDTFWSLAGIKAASALFYSQNDRERGDLYAREARLFEEDVRASFAAIESRLGRSIIPATPTRVFDESAIGSICSIYPLQLFGGAHRHGAETVRALVKDFVDAKGFFHPFIHSGYNPYLTLQLAHSLLYLGDDDGARATAETILNQTTQPFSLPEAIHPFSGGGAMGDGHHGWAAAEIVLYLRDCLVRESGTSLQLFKDPGHGLLRDGVNTKLHNVPTSFGHLSCSLSFEEFGAATLDFAQEFESGSYPHNIEVYLPFKIVRIIPMPHTSRVTFTVKDGTTIIECTPDVRRLLLQREK
ncbi:MAG: hypothetical protein NTV54_09800 [Ignavibacteriales bacterium]|nr:hypothetical protein [Ignavibacteriales bacterium]